MVGSKLHVLVVCLLSVLEYLLFIQFILCSVYVFSDISFTFRSRLVMRNIIILWICVVEVTFSLRNHEIDKWTENGDIETEEIKRNIEVGVSSLKCNRFRIIQFFSLTCL